MFRSSAPLVTLAALVALSACAKKAPDQLPPPPSDASTAIPSGPAGVVPGSQEDFIASILSDTVHFGTDESDVREQDKSILQSQAQWLARYSDKRITVEGHADERGTRDYNLALGERRANAAKNYLVGLGVAPTRITTISYGKERPVALGSDESSWAQNRRAVTVTIQ
ncbi:MAG: peptidoglycan-associated lipoprotein Pal [Sphingobium sp.]